MVHANGGGLKAYFASYFAFCDVFHVDAPDEKTAVTATHIV